ESPAWLERLGVTRPCVYVTFGTEVANFAPFGLVAEAFADFDVDVVMTVGRNLDPDSIRPRPMNVRVEQYLAQRLVLARSSSLLVPGSHSNRKRSISIRCATRFVSSSPIKRLRLTPAPLQTRSRLCQNQPRLSP